MMGIVQRAADLVYTFRFLKLLTTPFEKTEAYEKGIIDENGKRVKKAETSEEKNAYTPFHRLVFNIKKALGGSQFASYASALYLIKEKYNISDDMLEKALRNSGVDLLDFLKEGNEWFVLEDNRLSPGIYYVKGPKVLNTTCEELVNKKDKVRVLHNSYPVGEIFGLSVYEALHVGTNQKVYVTPGELLK
jgi:hypothetical protein